MFFMTDIKNYYPYIVWHTSPLFHNIFISAYNITLKLKCMQILRYENWKEKHLGFFLLIFAPETK